MFNVAFLLAVVGGVPQTCILHYVQVKCWHRIKAPALWVELNSPEMDIIHEIIDEIIAEK